MLCAGPCRVLLDYTVLVMYGLFFPLLPPHTPTNQIGFVSRGPTCPNCPLKKSCLGLYGSKISLFHGRIPLGYSHTKFVQNTNTGNALRNFEGLAGYYFIFEVHVMGVLKNSMWEEKLLVCLITSCLDQIDSNYQNDECPCVNAKVFSLIQIANQK